MANPPHFTDLGLKDLEYLYHVKELLNNEYFWLTASPGEIVEALTKYANECRQGRVRMSIMVD